MRRKFIAVCAICVLLLVAVIFCFRAPAIFQRGNPLPYLAASMRIDEKRPYVEVGNHPCIYISRRGDCPALFKYVEESRGVEFVEQAGSAYMFTDGTDTLIVSSEVYWGKFTVWTVPQAASPTQPDR